MLLARRRPAWDAGAIRRSSAADIGALLRGNVVIRAGRSGGPEVLSAEPVRDLSGAPGIRDLAADAR